MKTISLLAAGLILSTQFITPAKADYCINNLAAHKIKLYLYWDRDGKNLITTVRGGHPYKGLKKDDFPLYVSFCDSKKWKYTTPNKDGVVTPVCQVDVFGANNYVTIHKIKHHGCYDVNYVNVKPDGETGRMSVLKDPACACKLF